MATHPQLDNLGRQVPILHPHQASPLPSWKDHRQVATVVLGGPMPFRLNGVDVGPWQRAPTDRVGWSRWAREGPGGLEVPPFDAQGTKAAAGAVVVEPDGRVWLAAPTNAFGGAKATFPKGHANGLELQAAALKEVFEETGLRVELLSHLIDVTRSTTRTRYYLARRTGGTPAGMGWESQAVLLVPAEDLKTVLTKAVDHQVVDALLERSGEWAGWFRRRRPAPDETQSSRS